MKVSFSINTYDRDGDIVEKCVNLHINDNITLHFERVAEYEAFHKRLLLMQQEIEETWQDHNIHS